MGQQHFQHSISLMGPFEQTEKRNYLCSKRNCRIA